jgi:hypothetical protein
VFTVYQECVSLSIVRTLTREEPAKHPFCPSFPRPSSVVPPEHFFSMRGVLSAQAGTHSSSLLPLSALLRYTASY